MLYETVVRKLFFAKSLLLALALASLVPVSHALDTTATVGTVPVAQTIQLKQGWNLIGNGTNLPVGIVGRFGSYEFPRTGVSDKIVSIWKWNPVHNRWAFFTPSKSSSDLSSYTAGRGYEFLSVVWPGEGYWINASSDLTLPDTGSLPVKIRSSSLVKNWNLVSSGETVTPSNFNRNLSDTPPLPSDPAVPQNLTSLWAWKNDGTSSGWYFYAPALEADNSLQTYAASKGYLDFTSAGKSLEPGMGFWINAPAAPVNPTVGLPPLDQAKAMVQDLHAIGGVFSTVQKNGFLDQLASRLTTEGNNAVLGNVGLMERRATMLSMAAHLFADIDAGRSGRYEVNITTPANPRAFVVKAESRFGARIYSEARVCSVATGALDINSRVIPANVSNTAICEIAEPYQFGGGQYYSLAQRYSVTKGTSAYAVSVTASSYVYLMSSSMGYDLNDLLHNIPSVSSSSTVLTGPAGATYSETRNSAGNPVAASLAGDFPHPPGLINTIRDRYNLTFARSSAPTSPGVYTWTMDGSLKTIDGAGATLSSLNLESGSQIDNAEDAVGNPTGAGSLQKMTLIFSETTPNFRIGGTLWATEFGFDADNRSHGPSSVLFNGTATETASSGVSQFAQMTASLVERDRNLFHSMQSESAINMRKQRFGITAVIQAPGKQPLNLAMSSTRANLSNTGFVPGHFFSGRFAFGPQRSLGFGWAEPDWDVPFLIGGINHDGLRFSEQSDRTWKIFDQAGTSLLGTINASGNRADFSDGTFQSME